MGAMHLLTAFGEVKAILDKLSQLSRSLYFREGFCYSCFMAKKKRERDPYNGLIYRAYLRDGENIHTGEALLLACLLHAKGKGRNSNDMKDVQKMMHDRNLDKVG